MLSRAEKDIVDGLDPTMRDIALRHRQRVVDRGISFRFTSGLRSLARQRELFDSLPPGQVATPGTSLHEIGFAYDITGPTANQWDTVGIEGEALGLTWGGRFRTVREPWHFQAPETRAQLRRVQVLKLAAIISVLGAVALVRQRT